MSFGNECSCCRVSIYERHVVDGIGGIVREKLDEINERTNELSMSRVLYEFECKLYHQHLGHGADAEDIHGDADLHGRTCNQQNHPALVAVIIRQSLINRVMTYRVCR